jgi:hypothetical protein
MNTLLNTIRKKIRFILKESVVSMHAEERLKERLLSNLSYEIGYEDGPRNYIAIGRYTIPEKTKVSILNKIEILKSKQFPKNKSFGVRLETISIDPNYIKFYPGYNEISLRGKNIVLIPGGDESNGTIYYAIIRNNEITTIMLMKNYINLDNNKLRTDIMVSKWDTIVQNKIR